MVRFGLGLFAGLAVAVTLAFALWPRSPAAPPPPAPVYLDAVRDALKLEVLEVEAHQVVRYAPDPIAHDGLGAQLAAWARDSLAPEEGEAVVFATVRYFVDVERLPPNALVLNGDEARLTLPPVAVAVELKPEETLVVRSSLAPGGEAALLARAKQQLQTSAELNRKLVARAELNAARAARELLLARGYKPVVEQPAVR